jgi:hypothetical protein
VAPQEPLGEQPTYAPLRRHGSIHKSILASIARILRNGVRAPFCHRADRIDIQARPHDHCLAEKSVLVVVDGDLGSSGSQDGAGIDPLVQ